MFTLYILLFCIYSRLVRCQYGFAYPNATDPTDKNLALDLGETIDIEWKTPFSAINLGFIAEDGKVFEFFSQGNTANDFRWAVNVNNSGSSSSYYYLYIENHADNTQHYYSALFQVVDPVNAAQSLSSQAAVTSTPSPTAKATAITQSGEVIILEQSTTLSTSSTSRPSSSLSTSSQSSPSPTPFSATTTKPDTTTASASSTSTPIPSQGGLSKKAKIGLGVGIPIGIIALAGLAVLAVWSSWRHSSAATRKQRADNDAPLEVPLEEAMRHMEPPLAFMGQASHPSPTQTGIFRSPPPQSVTNVRGYHELSQSGPQASQVSRYR